jgi:hypothetical protein
MSDIPPRHPNARPRQDTAPFDPEADRAFVGEWLAHVAAGRIGRKLEPSEEVRAIHAANARLICGGRGRALR